MKKIPPPLPAASKNKPKCSVTHYIFVVDESGSIGNLRYALTEQLHAQARGILAAVKAENEKPGAVQQKVTATMVTFGAHRLGVRPSWGNDEGPWLLFTRGPMEQVLDFRSTSQGSTPLFDSVGYAIESMGIYERDLSLDDDESFVMIVISDGEELSSRQYGMLSLQELFRSKQNYSDRWTFAWQLPHNYIAQFVNSFGFDRASVIGWDQTELGVREATTVQVDATTSFLSARSKGMRSTRTYYSVSAPALTKTEVADALPQIPISRVRALEVDKETSISELVKEHGLPFVAGAGYYLLTKKEKIQDYKSLILCPRGEKKYYVGKQDARQLLGLPTTGDIYVEPGNHGDWLIYVQSTSVNRKLVRGTKLLYRLDVREGDAPETWDWKKAHQEAQKKQLAVAQDRSQPTDLRVFGAIFADKSKLADICAALNDVRVGIFEVENALKRLKRQGLIEFTALSNDQPKKGWKVVKGAKPPQAPATP